VPKLQTETVSTQIGDVRIAASSDAIVVVGLPKSDEFEAECARWERSHPATRPGSSAALVRRAAEAIVAYFRGDMAALSGVATDPDVAPATRRVLDAVSAIPAGSTLAYSDIAKRLGYGKLGPRFVGSANARNPVPLFIPCHRVVGKDGSLVGYGGSVELKQWLLNWERHHTAQRNPE